MTTQPEILPLKNDVGALANRINTETRPLHDKIDKQVTLKFALALRDYKIYRQGLQSFYHVFQSIERALNYQFSREDAATDEYVVMLKKIWKPEIARTAKAEQDLLFYYNDQKEKFVNPIMPEQIKFSHHIETVSKEKPYILLAYMHVMYLALFAGGKVLKSNLSRATGMFPQKPGYKHEEIVKMGINFFNFDVEDMETLRIVYKRDYELFTRNFLTEEQKQEIIEESKFIFKQNAVCVSELEKHNLARIKSKWSYIAITKGYYAALLLMTVAVLYYVRRITLHFI